MTEEVAWAAEAAAAELAALADDMAAAAEATAAEEVAFAADVAATADEEAAWTLETDATEADATEADEDEVAIEAARTFACLASDAVGK